MADLGGVFNAREVKPTGSFDPIPAGPYRCAITKSDWKKTKNGAGRYMEIVFEILEGEHKGRRIWERLNLENPSAQAVEIARGTLSAICHAIGVLEPNDTAQLHGIPLVVHVKLKKRADTGELTNEPAKYESVEEAAKAAQAGAAQSGNGQPAMAGSAADDVPWG